jgi:hypothetical protein
MVVEFKTFKAKGYFVKLPYNSFDIALAHNVIEYKVSMHNDNIETINIQLNSHKNQTLGFCKNLTINQIERIVDFHEGVGGDGGKVYANYESFNLPNCKDAQSSFNSLLKSLNILLVNPYPPYGSCSEYSEFMQEAKRYFEARERTGDWFCIIKNEKI